MGKRFEMRHDNGQLIVSLRTDFPRPGRTHPSRFYLARHGQTDDNARRVFQGQGGRGLNALGREQARRLGERLAKSGIAAIASSDLERALETARIVGEVVGVEPTIDPRLREVDVGSWTGKGQEEIERLHPEEWAAWSVGLDVRRGGGETYAELAARIDGCLASLDIPDVSAPVLVVSHGGSIRSWCSRVCDPERGSSLEAVRNTALALIERVEPGVHRLCSWNDVAHLEGLT